MYNRILCGITVSGGLHNWLRCDLAYFIEDRYINIIKGPGKYETFHDIHDISYYNKFPMSR